MCVYQSIVLMFPIHVSINKLNICTFCMSACKACIHIFSSSKRQTNINSIQTACSYNKRIPDQFFQKPKKETRVAPLL